MRVKYCLMVLCVVTAVRAFADVTDAQTVIERQYTLPAMAQAELLSLLLRLEPPPNTTVKTDGSGVVVSAPQEVHDAVAPLVNLLSKVRADRKEAAKETARKAHMQKRLDRQKKQKKPAPVPADSSGLF